MARLGLIAAQTREECQARSLLLDRAPNMDNRPESSAPDAILDALLAATLRGADAHWPAGLVSKDLSARISAHGISGLLAGFPLEEYDWPEESIQLIREEARLQSLWEASHHRILSPLLEAAKTSGIGVLVMKGSALAYSLYSDPAHRRRGDSDLLIRPADLARMRRVLSEQSFNRSGSTGLLQEVWSRECSSGFSHDIDLHWAASGSPVIARSFPANAFFAAEQPLPDLSPHSLAPSMIHQMLQTCVNQASHRLVGMADTHPQASEVTTTGVRLIWTYDCHLIAHNLDAQQWDGLLSQASRSGLAGTLADGLIRARDALGTDLPAGCIETLETAAAGDVARAYYQAPNAATRFAMDLSASKGLAAKARVIWAHIMATPDLLRAQYPQSGAQPLWSLRLRRIFRLGFGRMRP